MQKQSYIIRYENNKEDFKEFFGKDAELYWKIWELHNIEKISYDILAHHYHYAKTTIKNFNDRVEEFLDNPRKRESENDILLEELTGSIMYPNEFICGANKLSLNAHKIFVEAIYLYQYGMELKIPRNHIMTFSTQYKNIERRRELFEELRVLQITVGTGEVIKAFTQIDDEKGTMKFEFTEDCLDYIDPLRYLLKHIVAGGLFKESFASNGK